MPGLPETGLRPISDGNHSDFRILLHTRIENGTFPGFRSRSGYHFRPLPGAAPLEVEDGICKQIEEKIWDLDGIKEMTSFARENVGVVSVQVERTKDAKLLADEIKVRVDSILNFPEEAEKAMVEVATQKRKVLAVAIHGKADPRSLRKLADKTLDDLTNLPVSRRWRLPE